MDDRLNERGKKNGDEKNIERKRKATEAKRQGFKGETRSTTTTTTTTAAMGDALNGSSGDATIAANAKSTDTSKGMDSTNKGNGNSDHNESTSAKKSSMGDATASTTKSGKHDESSKINSETGNSNKSKGSSHSNGDSKDGATNASNSANSTTNAAAPPPPPVLKGTLSYNLENRRHIIRGMWNYENSNTLSPQRFELLRTLRADEDPKILPMDGEFHGSFNLAYFHTTSKGKQKERSRIITESGVKIKFTKIQGKDREYTVDGTGTNQFGIFNINGTATPSKYEDDPTFHIVLRKRYAPSQVSSAPVEKKKSKNKKRKLGASGNADTDSAEQSGPLPPPSESYPSHVVCLRGKLNREQSEELGVGENVHKISGMWSSGLDLILADPQNTRGQCNRFEYEHKSSSTGKAFPISGRYFGWFDLTGDDNQRTRINEKDITLKFRKNNAGYYNVEGKGSNYFGKYNITGTMTQDNVITIFRHFLPRKVKNKEKAGGAAASNASGTSAGKANATSGGTATTTASTKSTTSSAPAAPSSTTTTSNANTASSTGATSTATSQPEPQLKLEDVVIPDEPLEPIPPPKRGSYSAVSRGVLRTNDDGSHTCQGQWAMTREHFTNGTTSNFSFRLEPHLVAEAANAMAKNGEKGAAATNENSGNAAAPLGSPTFPVDSALFKGSFQMKRGTTKHYSVYDQQIVLKFRKNTEGSFNVYGKGINSIGTFNLVGKLIVSSGRSGHVELYRMYPVPPKTAQSQSTGKPPKLSANTAKAPSMGNSRKNAKGSGAASGGSGVAKPGLARRESSRMVKLPSRLEDDDPQAQISRLLDKCGQVLKFMREKDVAAGAFFGNPVDPVAHGIPTYHQVITEPMDLGTIQQKMDAGQITTPEEFGRLTRLVFENAMTFNVEPTHVVHQAARNLLILFNQKFRDIERMTENIRRQHKLPPSTATPGEDKKSKKKGSDKKRKGSPEPPKSLKRQRQDEAHGMATANASAMAALVAASQAGTPVSRMEFNMLVQMIKQLQSQMVHAMTLLANLSSDSIDDPKIVTSIPTAPPVPMVPAFEPVLPVPAPAPPPPPEKKRAPKKVKEEKPKQEEEEKALTLEEQERLTAIINELPPDKLPGAIKIIQESANLAGDEEEIDLEIDQLDTATQRKLQRYVSKHVKSKRTKKTVPRKNSKKQQELKQKPVPKKSVSPPPQPAPTLTGPGSYFEFGNKDESDSDSDGEIKGEEEGESSQPASDKQSQKSAADSKKEDSDDEGGMGFGANWKIPTQSATASSADADDDGWAGAREEAEKAKVKEAEKKAREEKMRLEQEEAKNQQRKEAVEEILAQREQREANEKREKERQQEEAKKARQALIEKEKKKLESVPGDIDMEEQRKIMDEYSHTLADKQDDGDDDEDSDDEGGMGFGANWTMPTQSATASSADADDDGWAGAREEAEKAKAKEAEKKAREEKMRLEQEEAKNQRLKDAAEEIRAQREEQAANEKRDKERQKEEAEKARQALIEEEKKKLDDVAGDIDMEAQRRIMDKYSHNFLTDEGDGASPSSDFGF